MDIGVEGADGSRRIFVTAEGDTDTHINVRSTRHQQFEREIDNRVASFIVNREQTKVSIQPRNRADISFYGSFCGDFATSYPYQADTPPPPKVDIPPSLDYRPCPDGHTWVTADATCP